MSRREDIYDDDEVEVMLDTFTTAGAPTPSRHALGVQWTRYDRGGAPGADQRQLGRVV